MAPPVKGVYWMKIVNKTSFEHGVPPGVNECRAPPGVISVLYYITYSHDSIIRPGLIIFKLFENGLSTVLIIESFEISLNSTYNTNSTNNFSSSKSQLSTVLIKSF